MFYKADILNRNTDIHYAASRYFSPFCTSTIERSSIPANAGQKSFTKEVCRGIFFPKTKVTFFVVFIFTSMVALAFGESCPLSYKLKLQNPDSGIVEIEIIYDQPPTNELIMVLGEGGFDTAAFINAISDFEAVNEKGAALPIKSSISDGEGKYASIIQIDVNNAKTITILTRLSLLMPQMIHYHL